MDNENEYLPSYIIKFDFKSKFVKNYEHFLDLIKYNLDLRKFHFKIFVEI